MSKGNGFRVGALVMAIEENSPRVVNGGNRVRRGHVGEIVDGPQPARFLDTVMPFWRVRWGTAGLTTWSGQRFLLVIGGDGEEEEKETADGTEQCVG